MKNKSFQIISIIIYLCIPSLILAQNVDDIIAKHIEAHGGAEKWDKVESLKIAGEFTAFSEVKDFVRIKTKSGQYYANLHLGQHEVFEGFNGEKGWTIDPWQGIKYPRELNTAELNVFMQKAEFFTPFYKYKEKGHKVELVGKENIDGIDVFVLKLTRPNAKVEKWFINSETYLEYKCEMEWVDFGGGLPSESFFEDFQSVDGLIVPFYIERIFWQRNRVAQISNVEVNSKIDESLFEMPKSEGFEKIAFMIGDWEVKVNVWSRRQTWLSVGNTKSVSKTLARNMIQENICYEATFPQTDIKNLIYSESEGKYVLTIYNDLESDVKVFKGQFIDGVLVFDMIETEQNSQRFQYLYTFNNNNTYTLESKVSPNNGETWIPVSKFNYSRITK